jgi:hypothetical protein
VNLSGIGFVYLVLGQSYGEALVAHLPRPRGPGTALRHLGTRFGFGVWLAGGLLATGCGGPELPEGPEFGQAAAFGNHREVEVRLPAGDGSTQATTCQFGGHEVDWRTPLFEWTRQVRRPPGAP